MANFLYIIKYMFFLIFLLVNDQKALAYAGKYPIQNFTPIEYKAGIQNIDFAQNRNMTLFVANNLGVLSYNSHEWETHDFKTGKKKRSLAFDERSNRLYMGAQGDFGYFEADWEYTSLADQVPKQFNDFDEVWDVFIIESGSYFCTFQGIYVYDGEHIEVIRPAGNFERSFQANGKIFTQDQNGQLFEIDGLQLNQKHPQNQQNEVIAGLVSSEDGYLIIYNSGIIEQSTLFGVRSDHPKLSNALKGTYVNHVLQLSDNRLAVATQRAGLFLYDLQSQQIEQISTMEGLASNACLRSFQDYYGNLWVGMQNGIALISINAPMRFISQEINLQGSGYEAFETSNGTYFTTSNGIYYLARNAQKSRFLSGTEGPAYGIQEIAGSYYAGHHTGLFLLDGPQAQRIANTDGLWQIKQLQSNPNYVLGGTYSGLFLFKLDANRKLQAIQKIEGFEASSRFLEEDRQGRIWVGQYYQGLYQLTLSEDFSQVEVKQYDENHSQPTIQDQIILSQLNNELYLATQTGLYQFNPNNLEVKEAPLFAKQIGQQAVYLATEDQTNNIYVIADSLAAFYKQVSANNYQYVPSSLYQLRFHLNNDLLHLSKNTSNGVLLSANDGFIQYNPNLETPLSDGNSLVIKSVYDLGRQKEVYARNTFEEKPTQISGLNLRPGIKILKIEVESFQLGTLDKPSFRYRLQGLDEAFSEWTNATSKEYTNLKSGNYVFEVQTRNAFGETINSQPLSLQVQPQFYNTTLAKVLYAGLSIFLLFQIFAIQRRFYRRKTSKLAASKQQRIQEEQEKLAQIKRQKELEVQRLKEEKMESELQHVNRLLAASTMNLVVKNEFIESIKEELNAVKQKGKGTETKQALERLVKEIDINLRVQEDWEQFEYHFAAIHGTFLSRLRTNYPDLSPNEQKLCAFLRLNLNTKDIANLLGISLRGVEVARYRLRKKLDLERGQNLSKFILDY
ncbi:MAG: triple tyrosine motif-containing protein [Bacteroidota bacterium]